MSMSMSMAPWLKGLPLGFMPCSGASGAPGLPFSPVPCPGPPGPILNRPQKGLRCGPHLNRQQKGRPCGPMPCPAAPGPGCQPVQPASEEDSWKPHHPFSVFHPIVHSLESLLAWVTDDNDTDETGQAKLKKAGAQSSESSSSSVSSLGSNQRQTHSSGGDRASTVFTNGRRTAVTSANKSSDPFVVDEWTPVQSPLERSRPDWAYRRAITLYGTAALLSLPMTFPTFLEASLAEALPSAVEEATQKSGDSEASQKQRDGLPSLAESTLDSPRSRYAADRTITRKVFLDFSICPTAVRLDRTLGDRSQICSDGEPMGRVVLGLYGNQVPVTVQHFVEMVTGGAGSTYKGSIIHRSLPGQYLMAGFQGAVEKGEVKPPTKLELNPETVQAKAFLLDHQRPGTLSLALSENDDDPKLRQSSEYRNVEFLITTGPGPASQLDSRNVVFGTVLEGMDVIRAIAAVPTYLPDERIRQFNDLAVFLGDERAAKGRARWNQPLKAIVISDCGLLD